MKRSLGYKLLFIGCLLLIGPFALKFLGVNLRSIQSFVNLCYGFGLGAIATGAYMIHYRGKRKH